MKIEFLKLMKCPYCGTDFEVKEVYSGNEEEIVNGYIKCKCGDYPILGGILILKNSYTKKHIIKFIKKMKSTEEFIPYLFVNHAEDILRITSFLESKYMVVS